MAVKIRLQRHGRGKRPFYHIVATDSRKARDGQAIERLGDYNPLTKPATINVDVNRTVDWLEKGATPTDTVKAILKYKGVMFKKHLLRGVHKGALTMEVAEQKFTEWVEAHKNTVLDHQKKHHKEKSDRMAKLLEDETKKAEAREAKRKAALAAAEAAAAPVVEVNEVAADETAPVAEVTTEPATENPAEN